MWTNIAKLCGPESHLEVLCFQAFDQLDTSEDFDSHPRKICMEGGNLN